MISQLFSIGFITLMGAMLPGPDFAVVTKNTLVHSRRAGIYTSIGLGCAVMIHMTYCALGLAVVIYNSDMLFNIIKYLGGGYLIYLGTSSLFSKIPKRLMVNQEQSQTSDISSWTALRQGFICNLLNPKATLFFLSLFTMIVKPNTPFYWLGIYGVEVVFITMGWFTLLTFILSHERVTKLLGHSEKYIAKLLGIFLIIFGSVLILATR